MTFERSLNLESAIPELGRTEGWHQLVLTAQDQLVRDFREADMLFDESVRAERYVLVRVNQRYIYEKAPDWNEADEEKYGSASAKHNNLFKEIHGFLEGAGVFGRLHVVIRDAVHNAVEHGSNFCIDGDVSIRGVRGENKQLWVVEQPNPGIDFFCPNAMQKRYSDGVFLGKFFDKQSGRLRGGGQKAFQSPNIAVNSENLDTGWAVLILA